MKAAGSRAPRLTPVEGRAPAEDPASHPVHWAGPGARTLVVASGKGGVGKSNLAANLAVALGERGARVLLVDGDLAQANLDLLLGLHPRWDLQHVLSGERTLEEIVLEGPAGVRLVPAASGVPELEQLDDYRREFLIRGLGLLDAHADFVLIDTSSGASRQARSFCQAGDDVVVVTTPEMPSFSDAYALFKVLARHGLGRTPSLLVNMSGGAEEAEDTLRRFRLVARRFLGVEPGSWGFVPFDPSVARAVRLQEPVLTAFPRSPASIAYRALAARLWSGSGPDSTSLAQPHTPQRLEA